MPRGASNAVRQQPNLPTIEQPTPRLEPDLVRQAELTEAELRTRIAGIAPDDDLVAFTRRCLEAMAPELGQTIPQVLERQIREIYGREKVYIAARGGEAGRVPRNAKIRREFLAGERVAHLARKYQLSEQMVWIIVRDVR